LTEEKEMKLLHLLKNTQTDRMKTHKKGKRRKQAYIHICITIASKSIFLITYYIINARK